MNMVADLVEKGRVEYRIEWVGEDDHKFDRRSHRTPGLAVAEAAAGSAAGDASPTIRSALGVQWTSDAAEENARRPTR